MQATEPTPSMAGIANAINHELSGLLPYMRAEASDNLGSWVCFSGSFDPRETWKYNIYENSRHFRFSIRPKTGYYSGGDLEVELFQRDSKLPKFRKYTGTPEKVVQKLKSWVESVE